MTARLIVRVHPDDHVEVRVEGLSTADGNRPPGEKLCTKVTARLERDLGEVVERVFTGSNGDDTDLEITDQKHLKLGD